MNSTKNKLNNKISWQKLFLPNTHLENDLEKSHTKLELKYLIFISESLGSKET